MPEIPRFSWRVLLASTTLALVAATATYVALDHGSSSATVSPNKLGNGLSLGPDSVVQPLDKVTFTTFDGKTVALSSLKGPLVVNFFASYCTPCITEMPALQAAHRQLGSKVTFLGLAVSDRIDPAKALIKRTKVTYRTAQDRDGGVLATVQGSVLPTTVLIDAHGKIVATHPGALTRAALTKLVHDKLGISS